MQKAYIIVQTWAEEFVQGSTSINYVSLNRDAALIEFNKQVEGEKESDDGKYDTTEEYEGYYEAYNDGCAAESFNKLELVECEIS